MNLKTGVAEGDTRLYRRAAGEPANTTPEIFWTRDTGRKRLTYALNIHKKGSKSSADCSKGQSRPSDVTP